MSASGRLAEKTAIVTGATAGIGAAVTRLFAAEGARLVLVARRPDPGAELVAELGAERATFVPGDIADPTTAARAVGAAASTFGALDVLVNNAAMDYYGHLLDAELADVRRVLDTNFVGSLLMLQEAARSMRGRGGSIVNVTSRTASVGVATMAVYGASKGALLSLSRAAAVELAPHGIRVNAVAPGPTDTPLIRAWIDDQDDPVAFEQTVAASIPQRRLATPEEVAAAILYLASDESSHVTGTSIAVDGGYTAA